MNDIPNHVSPPYTDDARDDALFHYTSAAGLIGILRAKELWATAYYCSNDASELAVGRGFLTPELTRITRKMIDDGDPLVLTFLKRGVNPMEYAENFEQLVVETAFSLLSTYISCFCKPKGEEDFRHGLLSQWRAYGADGGYALQFSRKKLLEAIEKIENEKGGWAYDLKDVFYATQNPLQDKVLGHIDVFIQAYNDHLKAFGGPLEALLNTSTMPSPIAGLVGGPLEALLDYFIHTKNGHFSEERECRLSFVEPEAPDLQKIPTDCFDRGGLIVPYKRIPHSTIPLVDCLEWILIGPNSRMGARFKSVCQIVKASGLDIKVRPSHIPFVRS